MGHDTSHVPMLCIQFRHILQPLHKPTALANTRNHPQNKKSVQKFPPARNTNHPYPAVILTKLSDNRFPFPSHQFVAHGACQELIGDLFCRWVVLIQETKRSSNEKKNDLMAQTRGCEKWNRKRVVFPASCHNRFE